MKDTKEKWNDPINGEFEIEDLNTDEPEQSGEEHHEFSGVDGSWQENDTLPQNKQNPFRGALVLVGILLVLTLAAFSGVMIYFQIVKSQEEKVAVAVLAREEEWRTQEEAKRAKAEEELTALLETARQEGKLAGGQEVLDQIRSGLSEGTSVAEILRMLYSDQIVVASGGKYHFIPIDRNLKQSDYRMDQLNILDSGELQYVREGQVVSYKGIDVSKFQGKIDWEKVAADGVTFAFIRVGYRGYGSNGTLVEDENAKTNLQGAVGAGIKTGVYFYTQAITRAEAVEEADMVLDIISPYRIDCPVVIDVEKVSSSGGRMNALDAQTRTDVVKAFCETIAAAGYRPMIYHNLEMGAVLLDISQLEEYDKWFAYYRSEFYYPYAYKIWQYSDKGRVQGISGDVDLNIAFEALWE